MPFSAFRVANYFIKKSDFKITPMQVLKLVYIAHGWCLALTEQPLIDEPIEAWKYGPVIRDLYEIFKCYGNQQITQLAQYPYMEDEISEDFSRFLDKIWDMYGSYSGIKLSNLTHKVGSPWDQVWNKEGKCDGFYKIDNNLIKQYYSQQMNRA